MRRFPWFLIRSSHARRFASLTASTIPNRGLADGLHPGRSEHAAFKPAHSMGSEVPWVYAGH
jgi:hypothetical protein